MKRKQIYIEEAQERALKRLAAGRGVSEALVIREAIAKYVCDEPLPELEHPEDHPLWGIVGIGARGVREGGTDHDRILYGASKDEARRSHS